MKLIADRGLTRQSPVGRLVAFNLLLVAGIGVIGVVLDAPYWAANGHEPAAYDYLFWLLLALNGPSGFLADGMSRALGLDENARFLLMYVAWLLLVPVQWFAYVRLTEWAALQHARRMGVFGVAGLGVLFGFVSAALMWGSGQPSREYFVDVWFWPVRIAGLGLSGLWVANLLWHSRPGAHRHNTSLNQSTPG